MYQSLEEIEVALDLDSKNSTNYIILNNTILNNKYSVIKQINSGAFSIIYLVEDENGNQRAIKELFIERYCSRKNNRVYIDCEKCIKIKRDCEQYCVNKFNELKQDMKDEFEIIKKMKSNKIIKVYEWFEENGTLYLVMEYIEGENLKTILNDNNIDDRLEDFPEKEIEKLLYDLCETINVIHKNGYVHRDIKPSNIMKDSNGNYRLIDYITIKKVNTEIKSMVGTLHYRPPEYDKTKRKFYKSSDIYSLGMSIYHILKKSPPPDYIDRNDINEKKFQETILSLDNKFQNMIKKMTNLNPEERYQSIKEIEYELYPSFLNNVFKIFESK